MNRFSAAFCGLSVQMSPGQAQRAKEETGSESESSSLLDEWSEYADARAYADAPNSQRRRKKKKKISARKGTSAVREATWDRTSPDRAHSSNIAGSSMGNMGSNKHRAPRKIPARAPPGTGEITEVHLAHRATREAAREAGGGLSSSAEEEDELLKLLRTKHFGYGAFGVLSIFSMYLLYVALFYGTGAAARVAGFGFTGAPWKDASALQLAQGTGVVTWPSEYLSGDPEDSSRSGACFPTKRYDRRRAGEDISFPWEIQLWHALNSRKYCLVESTYAILGKKEPKKPDESFLRKGLPPVYAANGGKWDTGELLQHIRTTRCMCTNNQDKVTTDVECHKDIFCIWSSHCWYLGETCKTDEDRMRDVEGEVKAWKSELDKVEESTASSENTDQTGDTGINMADLVQKLRGLPTMDTITVPDA